MDLKRWVVAGGERREPETTISACSCVDCLREEGVSHGRSLESVGEESIQRSEELFRFSSKSIPRSGEGHRNTSQAEVGDVEP